MEGQGANHFSLTPFAHAAFFYPFAWGGIHAGIGGGLVMARYSFGDLGHDRNIPVMDFTVGMNIGNTFEVSYTLRTDFTLTSSRVTAGFTHRFRGR